MNEFNTVFGLDLGDKYNRYCMLDMAGEVVSTGQVANTQAGLTRLLGAIEPCLVALEAGTHSGWVSRLLAKLDSYATFPFLPKINRA